MLFGSSAVGEPGYGSGDELLEGEVPLDAPVVELTLEYDPEPPPSPIKAEFVPAWLVAVAVSAWLLNRWGA